MSKINLEEGSVVKAFLRYAIPAILGMIAMTSAWIVDGIFVGQFVGSEALAAINLAMPLLNILFGVGIMVGMGGATLANIKRGEGKAEDSNNYYSVTMTLIVGISLTATLICIVFGDFIAGLMGAQGELQQLVATYLRISSLFFIGFIGNTALDMFLRNDGFAVFPIVCIGMGSIVNVILDYVLIGVLDMGLAGAAWATGTSQILPMIIMTVFIFKKSSWKYMKPQFNLKDIQSMLFNGSSELLSNVSVGISGFIFNLIIMNQVGTLGVAAYSVAMYASSIAVSIFYGLASAIAPGVSLNIGRGDYKRVSEFKKVGLWASILSGVLLCVLLLTIGDPIATLFVGNDVEVKNLAVHITNYYAIAMVMMGVNIVASMYYTAVNRPLISAIIASMRSLIALIIGVMVLPLFFGQEGIWAATVFAEFVTLITVLIFFKKQTY